MVKIEEIEKDPMEALVGSELIRDAKGQAKVATTAALKGKDLVLLYFSASWCPPCRAFSPLLKEFYKHVAQNVEIIYISSDRALEDFETYFGTMPWLSLPAVGTADIKNQLAQTCKITGIPALLVLERATGHYVTNQNARQEVEQWKSNGGDKQGALRVVEEWKASPAVPLNEANLSAGGPGGIMGIFSMIAKNPAIIFGLIYIVKYLWRELKKYMPEEEPTATMIAQATAAAADESEF